MCLSFDTAPLLFRAAGDWSSKVHPKQDVPLALPPGKGG